MLLLRAIAIPSLPLVNAIVAITLLVFTHKQTINVDSGFVYFDLVLSLSIALKFEMGV